MRMTSFCTETFKTCNIQVLILVGGEDDLLDLFRSRLVTPEVTLLVLANYTYTTGIAMLPHVSPTPDSNCRPGAHVQNLTCLNLNCPSVEGRKLVSWGNGNLIISRILSLGNSWVYRRCEAQMRQCDKWPHRDGTLISDTPPACVLSHID